MSLDINVKIETDYEDYSITKKKIKCNSHSKAIELCIINVGLFKLSVTSYQGFKPLWTNFFRVFPGHDQRQALFVYRLIGAMHIGKFFDNHS